MSDPSTTSTIAVNNTNNKYSRRGRDKREGAVAEGAAAYEDEEGTGVKEEEETVAEGGAGHTRLQQIERTMPRQDNTIDTIPITNMPWGTR